jgi:hypothetical protein
VRLYSNENFSLAAILTMPKPNEANFELADQNAVLDPGLAPYVARVLEAVGYPDALVTDESKIGDFLEFGGEPHRFRRARGPWGERRPGDPEIKARNDAHLAHMARQFGVPVEPRDLIVAVAHRVRTREQTGAA